MCWACDHPEASRPEYLDYLRSIVAGHGWVVQQVERDGVHPPRAYTAGLTPHGLPEFVVTGLSLRRCASLLSSVAAHAMHAAPPMPGEQIALRDGPLIQVVPVAEPAAHLVMAIELYGPDVRALQVVHADDRGHWPWDRGYRGIRGGQPVLGPRPARLAPRR